jgi:hypothetical protein
VHYESSACARCSSPMRDRLLSKEITQDTQYASTLVGQSRFVLYLIVYIETATCAQVQSRIYSKKMCGRNKFLNECRFQNLQRKPTICIWRAQTYRIDRMLAWFLNDHTIPLLRDPYNYISKKCHSLGGKDVFEDRILFQQTICMMGKDAVEKFYDNDLFIRAGAAPEPIRATLFGKGGVQVLDGDSIDVENKCSCR